MMEKTGNSKKLKWIFLVLSIFATVKMLFFAFGLDEEYQLVMSYRNWQGDRLFFEMWEPHQTSAFLCTLLMSPFFAITGSTTGLVLYLRFCGTLLHLAVSFYFYSVLKKRMEKEGAFWLSLTYYNVIPKQIILPEFGMMQVWFLTLLLLFFMEYEEKKQIRYSVLSGIAMSLLVLSYPSCIILFPYFMILFYLRSEKRIWPLVIYSTVCGSCGAGYLLFILRGRSFWELLEIVSFILSGDITHSLTVGGKLLSAAGSIAVLLGLSLVCALPGFLYGKIKGQMEREKKITIFLFAGFAVQLLFWVVGNKGYEGLSLYLFLPVCLGILQSRKLEIEEKKTWISGLTACLLCLIAVLYLTDLTLMDSLPHTMPAAIWGMILLTKKWENNKLLYLLFMGFCFTAIVGKTYPVRSGVAYNNVLETRGILKEGPAIGTLSSYMNAYVYNCDYEDWKQFVEEGDRVLIVVDSVMNLGTIQYLFKDVEISHYSIVNPTAYDERLMQYWELYPEKKPNVIILDCWYGELRAEPDDFITNYIRKEIGEESYRDGKYIRVYRKNEK